MFQLKKSSGQWEGGILIGFYPFRQLNDLKTDGSYWKLFRKELKKHINNEDTVFWKKGFEILQNILHYHIIDGSHPAASLVSGNLTTLSGDTVSVVVSDMAISFNNAFVIERDWMFVNGIVHVIDRVLLPPSDPLPAKWARAFYLAKQGISVIRPFKIQDMIHL